MKRALLGAAVSTITAVALVGCATTASSNGTDAPKKKYTIGVAEANTSISFLATLDKAIKTEAASHGWDTVILNGNFDAATQANNVSTLIAKKVDVILVISSSPTSVVAPIAQAKKAGIPVIAVNAQLDKAAQIVTYVGASDFDYGVSQGKLLLQALPNGGKVAVILGPIGDTPQVQRLAGLNSVLKDHPEISIVATPSDGFDNAKNLAATQDLLAKYPKGSIDAIVAQGPQMYVGADYALKNGRGEIKFIAGDYSTQVEASIKSGALYGSVNQSPVLEGQLGARFAYYWLTGKKDKVKTPVYLIPLPEITKANVDKNPAEWTG